MLECLNDYISFIVLVGINIAVLTVSLEVIFRPNADRNKKNISILFDYYDFKG